MCDILRDEIVKNCRCTAYYIDQGGLLYYTYISDSTLEIIYNVLYLMKKFFHCIFLFGEIFFHFYIFFYFSLSLTRASPLIHFNMSGGRSAVLLNHVYVYTCVHIYI